MTQIILVRHGHVLGITPERFRGRTDLELTGRGRLQARATARYVAQRWHPVAIYTSPMGRCLATAEEVRRACGAPVLVLQELNDLDYGEWTNREHSEISKTYPELYQRWKQSPDLMQFPGGENLPRRAEQIAAALRLALESHVDDTVVMVSHDSSNRVLLLQAVQLPLSAYWSLTQDLCAVSEIQLGRTQRRVVSMNETAHLESMWGAGLENMSSSP